MLRDGAVNGDIPAPCNFLGIAVVSSGVLAAVYVDLSGVAGRGRRGRG